MDLGLDGKIVFVSGSNRGTGLAIAGAFCREGAKVIVHSLAEGGSEAAASEIGASYAVHGDIRSAEGSQQVIRQTLDAVGRVDCLVNNYGTALPGKWETTDTEDWIDAYQTNVLSATRLIQGFLPGMKEQHWGRIIQLGTIGSTRPNYIMPHYYAAKGALANTTASLAKALKNTGITVNTVSPGVILTEEVQAMYMARAAKKGWGDSWEEVEKAIAEFDFPNPVGRIARREEIADAVCFLCSERAAYINAQNLRIDGGYTDIV